jgi:hypothetical protein
MVTQFFLFVITILLFSIFWELSKISSLIKKVLHSAKHQSETRTVAV